MTDVETDDLASELKEEKAKRIKAENLAKSICYDKNILRDENVTLRKEIEKLREELDRE